MSNIKKTVSCLIALFILISAIPLIAPGMEGSGPLPSWSIYTIYSANDVGKFNSIGLDSNDHVHVSYHDATQGYLMYATNASGSWVSMPLETGAWAGQETSLAVDTNDFVHMVYYNYPNANLKYATNMGGSWASTGIDTAGNVGRYASLDVDSINYVHVSYYDQTNTALKYATNAGGSWSTTTVDSLNDVGWYTSIAVDNNDVVHIAYYDNTNGDLRYATNPGGVWTTTSIDTAGSVGVYCSIALDSQNKVHMVYWDATTGYLKYATNEDGAWTIGRIGDMAMNGLYTDTVIDSDDVVHVTFYDPIDGDLWYANDAFGDWTLGLVDSTDNVGRYPAMALDTLDNVHISYYDVTNMNLKYAQQILVEPTSPLSLSASAGNANVTLEWNVPLWDGGSPITGYNIYRGDVSGSETLLDSVGMVQWYLDTAVSNGQTYWYYVTAVNAVNESLTSNEVSATPMTVPTQPLALNITAGDSQITLDWEAPGDDGGSSVLYYLVYRGTVSGAEVALIAVYGSTSFRDAGVNNGVTYWYFVTAINEVGEGSSSERFSVTPIALPTAPNGLQALASTDSIDLTWSVPSYDGGAEITNYNVYRGSSSGAEVLLITLGNVTAFEDLDVDTGVMYWYHVRAVNDAGEGSASAEASALIPTIPSAALEIMAEAFDGTIGLGWAPPGSDGGSPVLGYHIYRGSSSGGEEYLTTVNVTGYVDTGLENGIELFYYVVAYNAIGNGSSSSEVSALPLALPSAPQSLAVMVEGPTILLTWDLPAIDGGSPITGYMIYRGTVSGGEGFLIMTGNVLEYVDAGLIIGQTYWYQVTAVNALGEGPSSNEANATVLSLPGAPLVLQAVLGDGSVILSWNAPASDGGSPIVGYDIFRGNASGAEEHLTTVETTNYTDIDVQTGLTYFYYVVAVNSQGAGPLSNEISVFPIALPSGGAVLSATAGNGQVNLSWTPPSDDGGSPILGYNIYRGLVSGGATFLAMTGNVLAYTDAGLTNGQTYWYHVAAVNVLGEGDLSNEGSAVPASVPGAPRATAAEAVQDDIVLTWDAPADNGGSSITNYLVYYTEDDEKVLLATVGNVLSYIDSTVEPGVWRTYAISAVNIMGEGPVSIEVSSVVIAAPSAPLNVETMEAAQGILLSWNAPADDGGSPIIGYSVYRGTINSGETLLARLGDVQVFLDEGVDVGSTYYYYVTANNSAGESPASNEASISLLSTASAPGDLGGTPGDSTVLLVWSAPSDDGGSPVTGYKVYRVNESGEVVLLTTVVGLGYTDENVTNGETYAYYVVPTSDVGDGAWSDVVLVTPMAPEEDKFDWVFWSHLILFIVVLLLLIYYLYRRMKDKEEPEPKGEEAPSAKKEATEAESKVEEGPRKEGKKRTK